MRINKNIILKGKIIFDPENRTRKHNRQSDWKRVAIVAFEGDMNHYYAWFVQRRYGIELNSTHIRGSHVTFINDAIREISGGDVNWDLVRERWDGKEISINLNPDVRTNGKYWWLSAKSRSFDKIRKELGMGKPYFDYHMTIGSANERNIDQSRYIHKLIEEFGIDYN